MCGIAVIAGPRAASHRPALRRMLRQLTHRGPDGEGESASPACLLGHRRLSIIDREGGAQPLQNPACGLSVVCNGEIYNFRELRRRLSFPYQTRSDSEVLLAAYAAYGLELCGHLRGMFAFALWDERRQRLICGRDRFGEKPLYYAFAPDGSLLVASEVKALLASGLLQPHLDRQALAAYLQLRFVPEGRSMVEGAAPPAGQGGEPVSGGGRGSRPFIERRTGFHVHCGPDGPDAEGTGLCPGSGRGQG